MKSDKWRTYTEHGSQGEPVGKPTWEKTQEVLSCPHCEGVLVAVSIQMKNVPQLRGGSGKGMYLGCPCCPYASPMMIVSSAGIFPTDKSPGRPT